MREQREREEELTGREAPGFDIAWRCAEFEALAEHKKNLLGSLSRVMLEISREWPMVDCDALRCGIEKVIDEFPRERDEKGETQ